MSSPDRRTTGPFRRIGLVLRGMGWPLLAGGLAALAFPPLPLLPLLPFAFLVLMRAIDRAPTTLRAALAGFAFGFGVHAVGLYWLINAILIRASEFWWFVPFPSLGCALILAPFAAVPAAVCRCVPAGWRRCVLFAAVWTLCDMGRQFLFSGFTWNPLGSDWAIHGLVGDIMIQPAAWLGVDGLTLVTVILALTMPLGRRALMAGAFVVMLWAGAGALRFYGLASQADVAAAGPTAPVVALVQGNVPEQEKISRLDMQKVFERYLALTHRGVTGALEESGRTQGAARPVVYVWPETAFPGVLDEDAQARSMIVRTAEGASAGIVGTLRIGPDQHWRNSVVGLDETGEVAAVYDKATLVPFGEYQPRFLPLQVVPGGGMTPGPGPRSWHLPGLEAAGPLVCYEVIFSGHVVDRHDRPGWLVNVTNDAWYGNSAGPRQHLAAVRLRAVEEGLPVARAANTGVSIVYDARGHDLGRLEWGIEGVLVRTMPPALPPTIFSRFGQKIPVALCLLAALLALFPSRFPSRSGWRVRSGR